MLLHCHAYLGGALPILIPPQFEAHFGLMGWSSEPQGAPGMVFEVPWHTVIWSLFALLGCWVRTQPASVAQFKLLLH